MTSLLAPPAIVSPQIRADELSRRSFYHFIKNGWEVMEPGTPYVDNFHMGAIAEHLQAVTEEKISRLIIAIPPGHAKSLLSSIFWPAWEWGHDPTLRYMCGSYDPRLVLKDAVKTRDLVRSKWYRRVFEPDWEVKADQNSKSFYMNTKQGLRFSFFMGSFSKTGWRGERLIIDDPISVEDRFDRNKHMKIAQTYDVVLSTRLNQMRHNAKVVIMQRVAFDDLIGHILENEENEHYEKLILPAEFDPRKRYFTCLGWTDPRQEEGDLLFPAMYPKHELEIKKYQLDLDYDAQFQQEPVQDSGSRFNRTDFRYWTWASGGRVKIERDGDAVDYYHFASLSVGVFADLAASLKQHADNSAFIVCAVTPKNDILVIDVFKKRMEESDNIKKALELYTTKYFELRTPGFIVVEDNGNALPQIQGMQNAGLPVIPVSSYDDLYVRTSAISQKMKAHKVFFPENELWLREFEDELLKFPAAAHDDQVSALALAGEYIHAQFGQVVGSTVVQKKEGFSLESGLRPSLHHRLVTGERAVHEAIKSKIGDSVVKNGYTFGKKLE